MFHLIPIPGERRNYARLPVAFLVQLSVIGVVILLFFLYVSGLRIA